MQNKYLWATISIAVMWAATALVSVFGPLLEIQSGGGSEVVAIPVLALTIGFFALIGTIIVGMSGFRE